MTSIRAHWNPNDTPDRSSLFSFRLKNTRPLILAPNIILTPMIMRHAQY